MAVMHFYSAVLMSAENKVVMADLKKDLAELGFENPVSLHQ